MAKLIKRDSKMTGLPPGTLIHVGERKIENVKITLIDYNKIEHREIIAKDVKECFPFDKNSNVTWINIDGIHNSEVIEKIGNHLNLHPLLLEDVMNAHQRPKMEDYGDYIFMVLKMIYQNPEQGKLEIEQVSLILGPNYVVSFQEIEGDVFNPIRERLRKDKGKIRKMGASYLAYTLIDAIIDHYFVLFEGTGDKIEEIEEELIHEPSLKTLQAIHSLKKEMIYLRKSVWPLREAINGLQKTESTLIEKSVDIYLRDVYDHTIQIIDTIESFRDTISGMLDIYLSSLSNKMNEVMKVLTIIATIFIPLTFIAGIYGMNFVYIPELQLRWGYFAALFVMAVVAILMLFYFRKKKWL